jgi:hypothetical protein
MSIAASTYPPMMPTRPCSFCLCLQGGSVFADFDTDESEIVSLRRISFDGFGCCSVDGQTTKMSSDDSRILLSAIASGQLETAPVDAALRRYFAENSNVIWDDALTEHELL